VSRILLSELISLFLIVSKAFIEVANDKFIFCYNKTRLLDETSFCTTFAPTLEGSLGACGERAPAGAGSYPIHLLSDFIDVRARAIFFLHTSSSSPQAVATSAF
jgi:hypothetical protein